MICLGGRGGGSLALPKVAFSLREKNANCESARSDKSARDGDHGTASIGLLLAGARRRLNLDRDRLWGQGDAFKIEQSLQSQRDRRFQFQRRLDQPADFASLECGDGLTVDIGDSV